MKIGVLALQGDFEEHIAVLDTLSVETREVRLEGELDGLDGLIIPGGESTTIGKLADEFGLIEPLKRFGAEKAIWGTCAGAILLSKDVHRKQPLLNLMDIQVERNAFGRQVNSFQTNIEVPALNHAGLGDELFHAVFIRAPLIESVNKDARILAQLPDGSIVAAEQGHFLATSFHPELSGDDRFHRYFTQMTGEQPA
jgi:5'-phosphate synthase pdxT subunit